MSRASPCIVLHAALAAASAALIWDEKASLMRLGGFQVSI